MSADIAAGSFDSFMFLMEFIIPSAEVEVASKSYVSIVVFFVVFLRRASLTASSRDVTLSFRSCVQQSQLSHRPYPPPMRFERRLT